MNNIMLAGERQIGKSTIINFLLEDFHGKACGFKTLQDNDLYYLSSLSSQNISTEKQYICRKNKSGTLEGITQVFDEKGAPTLKNCLEESPDLIIMDELGVFENNAFLFQESVLECLNSTIPVLGVLKAKASPFLDLIRKRDDTTIFTITEDNRDRIKEIIKNKLYQCWV